MIDMRKMSKKAKSTIYIMLAVYMAACFWIGFVSVVSSDRIHREWEKMLWALK